MNKANKLIKLIEDRDYSGPICPTCKKDPIKIDGKLVCPKCKKEVPIPDFRKKK